MRMSCGNAAGMTPALHGHTFFYLFVTLAELSAGAGNFNFARSCPVIGDSDSASKKIIAPLGLTTSCWLWAAMQAELHYAVALLEASSWQTRYAVATVMQLLVGKLPSCTRLH